MKKRYEKKYNVTISVSILKFKQDPSSSATLITGSKNKTTWDTSMTKREIRAFGKSSAFSNDTLEVNVKVENDVKGTERTINPYRSGYSECIHNGSIEYVDSIYN